MDKWKIRTKIEVGFGIIVVLMLLSVAIIPALTRTITSSSDTIDTYIRNSKGNYWVASGTNIQTAIDDLTNGGTVWLPSGNLTISIGLTLLSNVAIIGCGVNITRINYFAAAGGFIPITIDGKQNVTLRDFTIDMHDGGSNSLYIAGSSKNIWIEDILFVKSGYQSIYSAGGCRNLFLSNIKVYSGITTPGHGIGLDKVNDSVINNYICEAYTYNIAQDGIDFNRCQNITLNNAIVKGLGWNDGIKINYCKKILVSNIIVKDVHGYGIKLSQNSYVDISNFYVENTSSGIYSDSTGNHYDLSNGHIIDTELIGLYIDSSTNVSCSNIEIYDAGTKGISLTGTNVVMDNLRIFKSGSDGKIYSSSKNILITNSIFAYTTGMGLSIDGTSQMVISNCIFDSNTGDGIDTTITSCNNYSITNCYFKGNAKAIDLKSDDNWFLVTNCICDPSDGIDINAALSSTRRVNNSICVLTQS